MNFFFWRKHAPRVSPRSLCNLVNNPKQSLNARKHLKIRYFEKGLSKSLNKVNFIFSFKPKSLLMDKIMKNSLFHENDCKCYKKLTSRSWPIMLFTIKIAIFLNIHAPLLLENKVFMIVFLSKLDHKPLLSLYILQNCSNVRIGFND